MTLVKDEAKSDTIVDLVASLRQKGVMLWSKRGDICFRGPKGALSQDDVRCLQRHKELIVAYLEGVASSAVEAKPHLNPWPNRAPLTFSQHQHWNLYQLNERRVLRGVAAVVRVQGALDIQTFWIALRSVVRRHDALRSRILVSDGVPLQVISESDDCDFSVQDLMGLPNPVKEPEINRLVDKHLLESVDVSADALFSVRVLKLSRDEFVLIVSMEHMISDACSRGIVLRDIFAAYDQIRKGQELTSQKPALQFSEYARWQRNTAGAWIEKHAPYWRDRLRGCSRMRFPSAPDLAASDHRGWGVAHFRIPSNLKAELGQWCRLRRTTLVMGAFTAYTALALRWCNESDAVIQFQSNGRFSSRVENAVGYFASVLYLRVLLSATDTFADLLHQLTKEYCDSYEHADCSYLSAQMPRPEFTRNSVFNWIPLQAEDERSSSDGFADGISCSPMEFTHPIVGKLDLDQEPVMLLHESVADVVGQMMFPVSRNSTATMSKFGREFLRVIELMVSNPDYRVMDLQFK